MDLSQTTYYYYYYYYYYYCFGGAYLIGPMVYVNTYIFKHFY